MIESVPWLILTPLVWASLAFLLGPDRGGRLAILGISLQLVLSAMLAVEVATSGPRPPYRVGGWGAPLGIDLTADGLAGLMLVLANAVGLPVALHARAYFAEAKGGAYFWPLAGFLLAAMNALFLSGDLFNLYVTLELLSLAAVGLVAIGAGAGQIAAAMRYLLTSLLGSGGYLLGVALLYGTYGGVSLATLGPLVTNDAPMAVWLAAGMMLTGLLLKTALFPFHFWLPPAHGGAPAPVSALLSALVVKATFYLILRLWLDLFAPLTTQGVAFLLGGLGSAAILWGSAMAIKASRLKMLVAYSTVAQIGYLFLLFPLFADTNPVAAASALQGGVMQAVTHAMAKAAMFIAAGTIILSVGRDDIASLAGISSRLPLTLFTIALSGITLMGLPPSGGFIAKWLLIDAALKSGQWGWVVVMILGGLLSAAYVFKILRQAFLPADGPMESALLPPVLEWPAFLLALASLVLGIRAEEILSLLEK